ncbi:MAG TPA: ATP-binding protein [Ramlibacter sp.]
MAAAWTRRLAALLLSAWAGFAAAQGACDARAPIASVERTVSRVEAPPATTTVTLPDELPRPLRLEQVRLRYTLDVSACADVGNAALWLFRVGAPFTIHDDAGRPLTLLSAGGRLPTDQWVAAMSASDRAVYNGRIPALFALEPGTRAVRIDLQTIPFIPSGIVAAEVGPTNLLLPVQARTLEGVVAFADVASGVVLVLGALALLLWTRRQADRSLLWLAVACGLWGWRGLAYYAPLVPLAPALFEQFNPLNVLLAAAAVSASVLSLLDAWTPRMRRLLWIGTAICVAGLVLSVTLQRGALATRGLSLAAGFVMISLLLLAVWRRRARLATWHVATLVIGLGGLLFCAVHDVLVIGGLLGPNEPSYVFWGFAAMLVGFAAMSGQYVVLTLNRAERANEELEAHVRRKSGELEQSYTRLRESEQEAARTQERERLLRDMHDGLGAQLMTMLRGVEREALPPAQLRQSLQDSIDELRLLMDSTDLGQYLPGALAAWRNRWDHRLQAAGVTLEWHIADGVDDVQLTGEAALQVMRILQEAAANIVKHAQARGMVLDARVLEQASGATLCIAIRDDGRGLQLPGERAGGRGLANMRHRAAQIGADLAVGPRSDGAGTEVVLWLPLPGYQATSPRRAASIAASARDEIPSLR